MKDICSIVQENKKVLKVRDTLMEIFRPIAKDFSVTIGGSYALKYWCEAFANREISDYDFIVRVCPSEANSILNYLNKLCTLGIVGHPNAYYNYPSFYMGCCLGKRINVIVVSTNDPSIPIGLYESVNNIIDIKKAWVRREEQSHRQPRAKDLKDIETYEKWVNDTNLPF